MFFGTPAALHRIKLQATRPNVAKPPASIYSVQSPATN